MSTTAQRVAAIVAGAVFTIASLFVLTSDPTPTRAFEPPPGLAPAGWQAVDIGDHRVDVPGGWRVYAEGGAPCHSGPAPAVYLGPRRALPDWCPDAPPNASEPGIRLISDRSGVVIAASGVPDSVVARVRASVRRSASWYVLHEPLAPEPAPRAWRRVRVGQFSFAVPRTWHHGGLLPPCPPYANETVYVGAGLPGLCAASSGELEAPKAYVAASSTAGFEAVRWFSYPRRRLGDIEVFVASRGSDSVRIGLDGTASLEIGLADPETARLILGSVRRVPHVPTPEPLVDDDRLACRRGHYVGRTLMDGVVTPGTARWESPEAALAAVLPRYPDGSLPPPGAFPRQRVDDRETHFLYPERRPEFVAVARFTEERGWNVEEIRACVAGGAPDPSIEITPRRVRAGGALQVTYTWDQSVYAVGIHLRLVDRAGRTAWFLTTHRPGSRATPYVRPGAQLQKPGLGGPGPWRLRLPPDLAPGHYDLCAPFGWVGASQDAVEACQTIRVH